MQGLSATLILKSLYRDLWWAEIAKRCVHRWNWWSIDKGSYSLLFVEGAIACWTDIALLIWTVLLQIHQIVLKSVTIVWGKDGQANMAKQANKQKTRCCTPINKIFYTTEFPCGKMHKCKMKKKKVYGKIFLSIFKIHKVIIGFMDYHLKICVYKIPALISKYITQRTIIFPSH